MVFHVVSLSALLNMANNNTALIRGGYDNGGYNSSTATGMVTIQVKSSGVKLTEAISNGSSRLNYGIVDVYYK